MSDFSGPLGAILAASRNEANVTDHYIGPYALCGRLNRNALAEDWRISFTHIFTLSVLSEKNDKIRKKKKKIHQTSQFLGQNAPARLESRLHIERPQEVSTFIWPLQW